MNKELMDILLLIIQIATLVFLIIYVIKTWHIASATKESAKATEKSADISRQVLEEMRENRAQETAPYVIAYFDVLSDKPFILLVIKNIGKGIAEKVRLEFEPQLQSIANPTINEALFIKDGIESMPPGYEIRAIFDNGIKYFEKEKKIPSVYKVKVSYTGGISSKPRNMEYTLDLMAINRTPYGEKTMDDPVNNMEELTKSVNSISKKLDNKDQNEK